MIILLGASCAGKTTIERKLVEHGYERIISYTTRPIRQKEINHIDYHFITDDEFDDKLKDNFFVEHTKYSWQYGIAEKDCLDNRIAVVEPTGFKQLKKVGGLNIKSFLILAPERERLIRMMKRGDNIMESFRRIISDQGAFNGMEDDVDHVINNDDGKLDETIKEIKNILNL